MRYAHIIDNLAVDIAEGDPSDLFHPDLADLFVEVPDAVEIGWVREGGTWSAPEATEPGSPPPAAPVRLAIIDLLRLFTTAELAGFNAVRKACQALVPADYELAAAGDEGKAALVGFEVFLTFYDALRAGLIELNHPETIQGLGLLVPLGVLSAERLTQVLAGEPPA